MQHTLKTSVTFQGIGLHGGKPVRMTLRPAAAGHGIWFKRTDIEIGDAMIPAIYDLVDRTPLCTRLVNAAGVSVSTVEHIMAALAGCGVHNALIELDGPEVPIMDGSSVEFVRGIMARGVRQQAAPVLAYEVLKAVTVEKDGARATLMPSDGLEIEFTIDFEDAAIGRQTRRMNMRNGSFARELSDSRTFCRRSDVEAMRANGLALGGTLENAVVVDGDEILTPGGLRHTDEAVRHKMLDALGDLYMAGGPILGCYVGDKAGHALTNALLRTLFETPGAVRPVLCTPEQAARLPGQGLIWSEIPQVA
ncbi:UDP-3-O-acyl-N-acetylglucosamine deacetylase [Ruegeria pomeroyi]|uniref:UDP-3-O-acyl-N-acetylglucosamine deacetylase n=2 Tax=Ruegeria pomeroyi TaxID=89184 RepID=Q5LU53_RUEPO|nr:UDP-3-O-acyl-N-acetylglucosamine deacetylase [Ruegeria pomeroyi]HCE70811.1 UDP-3-O-acyl-N-acetylglucosamine deacetylase [Ruegeria sp.]AAV94501.1 UDP-3-0-acyl N-acetylglucosamine deacetylase [Ruegeria pomeroyi DSS-3]NVK96716.1 UDP-3-O-acyl-N-acetylglucosamine deacetylase [Ruegeria pomeroyi]NVL01426.1 UDP-3-O-acyl-N-acetylglucosamine deacetylase [Ruegeria pomeroyi]QWV08081.1 UDP-3-O-acyl-N-acetylglucosamine deacetylase [Ruegeria pomeroyi]